MTAGRPTKYSEEMPKKVLEYIDSCQDSYEQIEAFDKEGNPILISRPAVNLPSRAGLSLYISIAKSTINEWEKQHDEFSVALKRLDAAQETKLLSGGLAGTYNSTIAKLGLSTNHGYAEQSKTDLTTDGEKIETAPAKVILELEEQLKKKLQG